MSDDLYLNNCVDLLVKAVANVVLALCGRAEPTGDTLIVDLAATLNQIAHDLRGAP